MSTCQSGFGFSDFWIAPNDPGASEVPAVGNLAVNNQFMNTVTLDIFQCLNATVGSQVWVKRIVNILPKVFHVPTFSDVISAQQLSTAQDAQVSYDFQGTVSATVLAGQSIMATLKYADNEGMSSNVVTVKSQTINISSGLVITENLPLSVGGIIPKGKYRQVTFIVSGATAPSVLTSAQEVLL